MQGDAGNAAELLYAGVEDAAGTLHVVAHDDAAVLQGTSWVAWGIPLGTFSDAGVDLTAISTMILGVGNRAAPERGLGGTAYFDDFRLMIPAPDAQ